MLSDPTGLLKNPDVSQLTHKFTRMITSETHTSALLNYVYFHILIIHNRHK